MTATYRALVLFAFALCSAAPAAGEEKERESASRGRNRESSYNYRYGGTFQGTYAYDHRVGYDFGTPDDNAAQHRHVRMPDQESRARSKHDRFDAYAEAFLYNREQSSDFRDVGGNFGYEAPSSAIEYYGFRRHIPLNYRDFRYYRNFTYDFAEPFYERP